MYIPYTVPVSIKGIVIENNKVWLRFNQRNEWELPGGKMDEGEQPEETCIREIKEELGMIVKIKDIVQAHLYTIKVSKDESKGVMVISYKCELVDKVGDFELEWEEGKAEFGQFALEEIDSINMPDFYKESIKKAWKI
jgi:8-oxo-dGTP pyrophosphatase MutT (NUDIX family)